MSSRTSGQKINYSVRPGKSIERKMIKDILSRLFVFDDLYWILFLYLVFLFLMLRFYF